MSDTIKAMNTILETAEKHGLIDKIKKLFAKKRTVLLLGTSGVGKTSLVASLNGLVPEAIHYLARTQIAIKHRMKFDGAKFEFVDTPGQEHHDSRRIKEIRQSMKQDHLGVINVTSFGYHEHSTGLPDAFRPDGIISQDYLARHREVEIEGLKEWVGLLGDTNTTRWFATVVTKADLWWDERDAAIDYYRNGKYSEHLGGMKQLHPVVIEFCSVIHRFYGEGPVCGTFDDEVRNILRLNFLKTLVEASKTL